MLCFIFLWLFFDWQALAYGIWVSLSPHTALIFSAWSNQKVFPVCIFKFSYPLPQLSLPTQLCCLYAYVTIISVYYLFLFYFGAYVFSKDIVLKAWTPAYGDIERWWKLKEAGPSGRGIGPCHQNLGTWEPLFLPPSPGCFAMCTPFQHNLPRHRSPKQEIWPPWTETS